MTLRFELGFDKPPAEVVDVQFVYGRIRALVDEQCLTQVRVEEPLEPDEWPIYDLDGRRVDEGSCPFVGEHLTLHLAELQEAALKVARGDFGDGDPVTVPLSTGAGEIYKFHVSPVDEHHVRIRFRDRGDVRRPATDEVTEGYVVPIRSLCEGVAEASETYRTYIRRALIEIDAPGQIDHGRTTI